MGDSVKRAYRSDVRTEQSARTRRAVVDSAAELFVTTGYGATTIDAVAHAAGVSRKTVFTAVGGKAELLRTALDWAVAGDDGPVAVADRPAVRELLEGADPVLLLTGWARLQAVIGARTAALYQVLEAAAQFDAEALELLATSREQRRTGASRIVARLAELDALSTVRRRADAVDVVWLASDPVLFDRMVRQCGWTERRFATWLGSLLTAQLLDG